MNTPNFWAVISDTVDMHLFLQIHEPKIKKFYIILLISEGVFLA